MFRFFCFVNIGIIVYNTIANSDSKKKKKVKKNVGKKQLGWIVNILL